MAELIRPSNKPAARWLLVSDSASLKQSALALWGGTRLAVTDVQPSHVMCEEEGADRRDSMLETVGELLLLAECDILVHSASRFPVMALLLGRGWRQSLLVDIDPQRCLRCADFINRSLTPRQTAGMISGMLGPELREVFASRHWDLEKKTAVNQIPPSDVYGRHLMMGCMRYISDPLKCRSGNPQAPEALGYMLHTSRKQGFNLTHLAMDNFTMYSVTHELNRSAVEWSHRLYMSTINQ